MNQRQKSDDAWRPIEFPLELSPEIVHVVRMRLDLSEALAAEYLKQLPAEEQVRAERFRFHDPRARFVGCRVPLRSILANCLGMAADAISFGYGANGKPELAAAPKAAAVQNAGTSIEFNLSHSGDWGLIALTVGSAVGVDIEQFDPRSEIQRLAERYFAKSEVAEFLQLSEESRQAGFYRGWTCKEAYMKATGRGMSQSLSSFAVRIDPDQPASLLSIDGEPDEPECWSVWSFDVTPNYAAAAMVARRPARLQLWDWPPQ